jgi:8-oxo-dGTP diphosphatase
MSRVRAGPARNTSTATARSLSKPTVHVVAAALYDAAGRVLIAQRPVGKHMAGRWEFPGGKIGSGESEEQALARELKEELGVDMRCGRPLLALSHEYEDYRVELSMWVVDGYDGEPRGLDGQGLKWVAPATLLEEDMLEADRPFIRALQRLGSR